MTDDLIEVHLTNRIARLSAEERDEWARRAVKTFQGMEYLWTSFARVLTGNRAARVVMSAGTTRTDGTTIYYRPPLMLGDPSPHNRNQCDRRNPDGHLICPACSVRETVERSITHEISHKVGGSFEKSSPEQQQTALRRAVMYARNPIAKAHLDESLRQIRWGDDIQLMMFKMSPFLGLIIMALEDARIDLRMFKARPGVRKMFASNAKRLSTVGHVDLDGNTVRWADNPLNAQIIIGLLWQAEGFDLGDLHDKVKKDIQDPVLQDICSRVDRTGSALEVAALTVECLVRLWELGYCEPPEAMPEPPPYEPPPPPEPPQDEEQDDPEEQPSDDSEDQGDSDNDSGDEGSPEQDSGDPGSDESDPGGGGDGEGGGGTQAEDSPGQPDIDETEGGEPGEGDVSDPGGDEPGSEQDGSQDSDDGEASGEPSSGPVDQDTDDGGSAGDSGDTQGGGGCEPQQDSGDDGNDEDRRDDDGSDGRDDSNLGEPGDGQDDGSSGPGDDDGTDEGASAGATGSESDGRSVESEPEGEPGSDAAADTDPGAGDDEGSGEDGGSDSTDDTSGGEDDGESSPQGDRGSEEDGPAESGSDLDPGSEPGDRDSQGEGDSGGEDSAEGGGEPGSVDNSVGSDNPGSAPGDDRTGEDAQGLPATDAPDSSPTSESGIDDAREDGAAEQRPANLPDSGTADDVADLIQDFTGHNHEDDDQVASSPMGGDPGLQRAVDKAIVQNKYFDAPSSTVTGLHIYEWPKHDRRCEAWSSMRQPGELTIRRHDTGGRGQSLWDILVTPEEVLQPALFEMKRVFADNQRTRDQRNLKKGRLDGRALGKRAWQREPERLYKKHERPKKRDYAVIVAGDCSWSQHLGKTMVVTKQAMFAQSELLHRMGIPFEVWANTAAYTEEYKRTREVEGYDMIMNQIKSWSDPWNEKQQEGLSWLHAVETNLDGHNLEFLRKRLMQSAATDKILLYYTDGEMPAANYGDELDVLKRELETYKRMNITLLGVGIGTDSPREYGLDTVRVDNKGDIIKVVKHLGGVLMNMHR